MRWAVTFLALLLISGCFAQQPKDSPGTTATGTGTPTTSGASGPNPLRVGVAQVRFDAGVPQEKRVPDWVFQDLRALGADAVRGLGPYDAHWYLLQPTANSPMDFSKLDQVAGRSVPIVAAPYRSRFPNENAPWDTWHDYVASPSTSPDHYSTPKANASAYLTAVAHRYGNDADPKIRFYELASHLDEWRFYDGFDCADNLCPDDVDWPPEGARELPSGEPAVPHPTYSTDQGRQDGFPVGQVAIFLTHTAEVLGQADPQALTIFPGPSRITDELLDWYEAVIYYHAPTYFDVFGYQDNGPWWTLETHFDQLNRTLHPSHPPPEVNQPKWVLSTGASSDSNNRNEADYGPNSASQQAADVFRRFSLLFGLGVEAVFWNGHVSQATGPWSHFGLRDPNGDAKPAWYTYQLFAAKLGNFSHVTPLRVLDGSDQVCAYRFTNPDQTRWVVWSRNATTYNLPVGGTPGASYRVTTVVPPTPGAPFPATTKASTSSGGTAVLNLNLSNLPYLIEPT